MSFTKRYIESLGIGSCNKLQAYIAQVDFTYDKKQKEDMWFENYKNEYELQLTEKETLDRIKETKNL